MNAHEPVPLGGVGKLALLGLGILPTIAMAAIAVMLPAIADAFGKTASDMAVKMVSTSLGLGMLIGAPLGGILADRIGRRLTLLVAVGVFGILGCAMMAASELWMLIAARFIIGLAAGTIGVGVAAVFGDYFTGSGQSRWIGYAGAAATFSSLVAIPLTGVLTDTHWRYGFALYAMAAPIFLAVLFGFPNLRLPNTAAHAGTGLNIPLDKIPWSALLLAFFMGTLATGTSLYWPFRLREVGVTSASAMAMHALPQMLMIGSATFAYGWLRRGLTIPQVFTIAAILSAGGLMIVAVAPNSGLILAGLAIEGFGIGMMTPNLTAFALAITDATYRGRVLGLIKGCLYGSPFVIQFVLQPLNLLGGSALALAGIAAMACLVALAVFRGWLGGARPAAAAQTD